MKASHFRALWISLSLLLACLLLPLNHTRAQTDDKTRGIQLYQQGDAAGAVVALKTATKRNKNDIEAWYYLGLALERQNKPNDARKAHEKAAQVGEKQVFALFVITERERYRATQQALKPVLVQAAESARRYLALSVNPSSKKSEEWRNRADLLDDFASADNAAGYSAKEVTTKAVISAKPEPTYTDEARRNGTTGTIALQVLLGANGKVMFIQILKGLPNGLNYTAVEAARRISFKPATIKGQPVSQWIQIQYDFNIY